MKKIAVSLTILCLAAVILSAASLPGSAGAEGLTDGTYEDGYQAGYAQGYKDGFAAAQARAVAGTALPTPTPAPKTTYILNTNTKVFHYESCPAVKQMKAKNRSSYTGYAADLIARGYRACGKCHPH